MADFFTDSPEVAEDEMIMDNNNRTTDRCFIAMVHHHTDVEAAF